MKATAELQVIPIGKGVSVRNEVKEVIELLSKYPLIIETHASGIPPQISRQLFKKSYSQI